MYTYLLINLLSISVPLWRSFDPRISLYKEWKILFPAILIPALLFIGWDVLFTHWGVWGFNPRYICGWYLLGLPIEEWLFFLCIPYASIFIYVALNYFIKKDLFQQSSKYISIVLIIALGVLGVLYWGRLYTSTTFILLSVFIFLMQFVWKVSYLGRFYLSYLVVLIPFFIVNGILTGTGIEEEVVWYNDAENLQIRMGTIPVEDTFYGMLLIMMGVALLEWFRKRMHLNKGHMR
ncbi:MAG: lycopene cyclase domain-containing protein [Cytophagaceae bacterium]